MKHSWLYDTDSYKLSHFNQYPKGMTSMYSYLEARDKSPMSYVVFFGLQYLLKEYLTKRISMDDVIQANKFFKAHGEPFNYEGWRHIAVNCGGYLPVKIKAVPEGSVIPCSNVLLTVESTDPAVPWITSYVETILERLWYPTTVATVSRQAKQVIYDYLLDTADKPDEEIEYKLHDFGSRGVSSQESASIGGGAHLVNFKGSDTVVAVRFLQEYYNVKDLSKIPGVSIPATEHSSITSWGKENEKDAYSNFVRKNRNYHHYACVSDSYNLSNALDIWGSLKDEIGPGKLVVRPDSGEPTDSVLLCLEKLDKYFGSTVNSKGYKVLNKVEVIQGDGIDNQIIQEILTNMMTKGWSASNVNFGMGGGLLQKVDRDTFSFSYKCSSVVIDGVRKDVFKEAPGKMSKRGELSLVREHGDFLTKSNEKRVDDILKTVFLDGHIIKECNLEEVRKRASLKGRGWKDMSVENYL